MEVYSRICAVRNQVRLNNEETSDSLNRLNDKALEIWATHLRNKAEWGRNVSGLPVGVLEFNALDPTLADAVRRGGTGAEPAGLTSEGWASESAWL